MEQSYFISIYLDTRRAKKNGKYPVKLRVFTKIPRKQKMYPTIFEFSPKEFESIFNTKKPRIELKNIRREIQAVEDKAEKIAKSLKPFTFKQFERRLFRQAGDGIKLNYHYSEIIAELTKQERIGTASNYDLSRKSLIKFFKGDFNNLTFYDIIPEWLNDYERYMTQTLGRSITTVGIYLRNLRAVFNKAIDEQEIERDYYPFGKRKYQIPAKRSTKKALSKEQLSILYNAKPLIPEQEKAKDFWFFSYACNGMNIKDIMLLKYKNIRVENIEFLRAKTLNTSKGELTPIVVPITEYIQSIIDKYGSKKISPNTYVFNLLNDDLTPIEKQKKVKNFTRYINQHIKILAKQNGLPEEISSYWARHSFATNSIRKGASMEFIQESLGHGDMNTTKDYFAGFTNKFKKEFADQLMDFNK